MTDDLVDRSHDPQTVVHRCDLCIVGAGIAGLNALFVASRYLSSDQKVVLVDRRERAGGMWVDTYPYVRLHQPHPFFTAGDIPWTLRKDRSYLATKGEVLDHLAHCLEVAKRRIRVDENFGWTMESDEEVDGIVRVTCRSADGRRQVIEAKRLIKAYGFRIVPNDPLPVSSDRVQSVSPDSCDVRQDAMRASAAPVWIIGGGKTAMDTAHALITEYPGREVNLVAGSGTFFNNRDAFFPTGASRWYRGRLVSKLAAEIAQRFDGTNETAVWDWHRSAYGLWSTPETGSFLLGVLSEAENEVISRGLNEVVMDHFVDAVDNGGGVDLVMRSGSRRVIEPGSWLVNCTGYVTAHEHAYEPYSSRSGAALSIQSRSATLHLTSFMGYFMTHLMFRGALADVPLYELDLQDLQQKSKTVFPYAVFTLVQHNLGLIADHVPARVFQDCGLDFDRWFPLHRRLTGTARFVLTHRRERDRLAHTLDTVRERFDVRCGPLFA